MNLQKVQEQYDQKIKDLKEQIKDLKSALKKNDTEKLKAVITDVRARYRIQQQRDFQARKQHEEQILKLKIMCYALADRLMEICPDDTLLEDVDYIRNTMDSRYKKGK